MSDTATASDEAPANPDRSLPAPGPVAGLFALYLLTILGGVALSGPFETAGVQTFEDPGNVANVGLIFAEIVVITVLFILITRYGYGLRVLRVLVLGVFGYATYLAVFGSGLPASEVLGAVLGTAVFVALLVHPEWYVIDAAAVVAGAAIIAQFGNGLGPLPALIFLVGMAVYDAYAVYVSEHMQQLGGGVGELRLPMMYVVPPSLLFSMEDMGNPFDAEGDDPDGADGSDDPDGEKSAMEDPESEASENRDESAGRETPILLGLGDAIVPGLLAVSAGQFLPAEPLIAGTIVNAPALGAIIGSAVGLAGLLGLLYAIERAHAGLPVLNACVILGYLAGAVAAGVPIATALGL
ncbi:MAG: presenilin family intramembrane aspartyl protease PSH [Halobacteriales archaeon]